MPLWFCSEPIGWASSFGQLHTVIVLTKNGADPLRVNSSNNSGLTDAKRERHQHVLDWIEEWRKVEGR
jgi:ankyrin repeat protein